MSKNLVIGMAIGYNVEKIQNFVVSLRRHYSDDILFIVDNINQATIDFLNDNSVHIYHLEESINLQLIGFIRWEFYRDLITEYFPDAENVLTSDVRDVIFQDDPFKHFTGSDLEFSSEPVLIGECVEHNALWIKNIYGNEVLDQCKDNWVLCAGVVGGRREGILRLCDLLIDEGKELKKINKLTFTDQASLNVLYGKGLFENSKIHHTGDDMIATMHHANTLTFDRQGYLLSNGGNKISMIHQYDRCSFSGLNMVKTALGLSGKKGVMVAANYAVNNFQEHDLG